MNIMVVGNGGREHALSWKISKSHLCTELYCAPGNAGTSQIAQNIPINVDDIDGLLDFAQSNSIDLTVVGPELPLTLGIVDLFKAAGLRCFGPSKGTSKLEGSKAFAKEFMKRHSIPTARFEVVYSKVEAINIVKKYGLPIVLKEDGLAGGKGVFVCNNRNDVENALEKLFESSVDKKIVIEECLVGVEVSYIVVSDGTNFVPLASSQDHKRLLDGDFGPNTGGMGAYSPAPVLTKVLEEFVQDQIVSKVIDGMKSEGCEFKGALYVGVMITNEGPKVLEFNVRFGDPETQPLMVRLVSDIVPIFLNSISGALKDVKLEWDDRPAVCIVLASSGYPESPKKGSTITGLDSIDLDDVILFHSGTSRNNGTISVSGGRVIGVTALGGDLITAISNGYKATEKISWPEKIYRSDIGHKGIML